MLKSAGFHVFHHEIHFTSPLPTLSNNVLVGTPEATWFLPIPCPAFGPVSSPTTLQNTLFLWLNRPSFC